jgi:uncharacterized protein
MQIPHDAVLLRIFIGENDRFEHAPLYEAIVLKAREMHLGGATVLRGPMGFGHSSRLHTTKILRLSEDLPFVIEIVDSEEKINQFLPVLDKMMGSEAILVRADFGRGDARARAFPEALERPVRRPLGSDDHRGKHLLSFLDGTCG